jgi:hypothetical protein
MRQPFPDWNTEGVYQLLEEYLLLAKAGDTLGLAFVDSVVFDLFCEMVEASADQFRRRLEDTQMTLSITAREREYSCPSEPKGCPYAQTCENCGATFWYHYDCHYCQDCEEVLFGEPERDMSEWSKRRALDKARWVSDHQAKERPAQARRQQSFKVMLDPIPVEEGGFKIGTKMSREEVETGVRLGVFESGMKFKYCFKNTTKVFYVKEYAGSYLLEPAR